MSATAVRFYDPTRRLTVVTTQHGRSHLTDRHGRLLCDPQRRRVHDYGQVTLDAMPSCGWCRLIHDTKEEP